MSASTATPGSACATSTQLLQRRLCNRDSAKWRTVLRVGPGHMPEAKKLIRLARAIDAGVEFRFAEDAK